LPAMELGVSINNVPAVSETAVLERIEKAQCILVDWFNFSRIDIVQTGKKNLSNSNGSKEKALQAVFFSGGVDSWHTFIENKDEIDVLVLVHGFDIPLSSKNEWEMVSKKLKKVAKDINVPIITVKTNLRAFSDQYVGWPIYHGSALGAVSAVLSPIISVTYIGSSFNTADLFPYGSHPDLDHLWNGHGHELIHYGCKANRIDKIRLIAENEDVRKSLRVCWKNSGNYNCSSCRKCTLTMLGLELFGQLENTPTFKKMDLLQLIRDYADFEDTASRIYFNEIIKAYQSKKPNSEILKELLKIKKTSMCRKNNIFKKLFYAVRSLF